MKTFSIFFKIRGYVADYDYIILTGTGEELRNNEHIKEAYLGI